MTISHEKKMEIVALLQQGQTLKSISQRMGVSRPTIIKIRGLLPRTQSKEGSESSERSENSEKSESSESSVSVTLGSEDTESESSSPTNSSRSSKSDDSGRKVFIQQRAFKEKMDENRDELEKFRISLLFDSDANKRNVKEFESKKISEGKKVDECKEIVASKKIDDDGKKIDVDCKKVEEGKNVKLGERKEALICKLELYVETFPQKLGQLTEGKHDFKAYLRTLALEELEKLLGQVRYRCSNAGISDSCSLAFQTVASLVEQAGIKSGLKLKGYAASLAQNKQARECLSELTIDYLSEVAITPQRRLIMICLMQGYSVHSANSLEEQTRSLLDEKIDPSLV